MCKSCPPSTINECDLTAVFPGQSTPLRCCGFLLLLSVARMSKLQSRRECPQFFCPALCADLIDTRVMTRLETADSKVEPSMQPLTILREVDLICHLWQRYVTMALLPLASSSVTVRREMVIYNNQAVSRIEGGVNQVTQKLADGMLAPY